MKIWKQYIIVLFITAGIFSVAYFLSSFVNDKKIDDIKKTQDKISINILTSETELDLAETLSCTDIDNNYLSKELVDLSSKIAYAEQNNTLSSLEILNLKKRYSIIQLQDFVLSKRVGEKCGDIPSTILYFYTTKENCPDCMKQGYVLDAVKSNNKSVRVYSFDADLELASINTLKTLYGIDGNLPVVVVNGIPLKGLQSVKEISELL